MTIGDEVVLLADPWERGIGVIDSVLRDGRLLVAWSDRYGDFDSVHPHEIELAAVWAARQVPAAA